MENSDSGLYQVEYQNGKEVLARKFDITIGSGMRGQTYLSWNADILTQLPVSYLTSANSWANSPGDKDQVYFDRPVNSRCLECHATYAKVLPFRFMNGPEEFDRHNVILTISCEKCHGPGAKHVNWQTENPEARVAKYIINPSQFSRQQSLDMCAVCHGGQIKSTKPTFSYVPGKKLTGYFKIGSPNDTSIDVHGNQLGLLKQSKCFRMTSTLTCLSCHNPHSDERNNLALFSAKCMRCHRVNLGTFCSVKNVTNNILRQNCIDCHMPKQVSKSIVLQVEDKQKPTAQLLRTHFIKVYGGATKKFFSQMAQNQK
jgi:hypothetical protein